MVYSDLVQESHTGCHQPFLDSLLVNVCQCEAHVPSMLRAQSNPQSKESHDNQAPHLASSLHFDTSPHLAQEYIMAQWNEVAGLLSAHDAS